MRITLVIRRLQAPVMLALALLVPSSAAAALGGSGGRDLGRYTLQLSDLGGREYKQIASFSLSNPKVIKEGVSPAAIRRYGRVGGYERDFRARNALQTDVIGVKARIVATRTAAGSHAAFLLAASRRPPSGLTFHLVSLRRVGDESRCYSFNTKRKGFSFQTLSCTWRQNRLVGEIVATGFRARKTFSPPLATLVKRILAKQVRRMAFFT